MHVLGLRICAWEYPLVSVRSPRFAWLAERGNYELRPRQPAVIGKPLDVVYFKHYDGELLWGATARMTLSLVQSLEVADC